MTYQLINLVEAFINRKFQEGEVKFPTSSLNDPVIQDLIKTISTLGKTSPQEIIGFIDHYVQEATDRAKIAPLLSHTMINNAVESALFKFFWEKRIQVPGAPVFNNVMFRKLVTAIRADHDEFFPLRGFIDKRRLFSPNYAYVNDGDTGRYKSIKTAAATPNGDFIFNIPFSQALLGFAHLKKLKAKGKKYISNGGDIPDEYAYLEFLIMHEFMHYSNDDFYYQKIIPKANNKIINWVGDFRTNYLLVKSGYAPLPIGLYNDKINYDRQKSYIDMYRAVEEEFNKLKEDQKDKIRQYMDGNSDDHTPGNQEGEEVEVDGATPGDIDKNSKDITDKMKDAKDTGKEEREKREAEEGKAKGGDPGTGKMGPAEALDYSKIRPTFNWKSLLTKFITSGRARVEETYAKPARKAVTQLSIARQTGASAIKPSEREVEQHVDLKLGFIIDSSGSMAGMARTIMSNAAALLKQPAFKRSTVTILKFSGGHEIFKCNFAADKAGKVANVNEKPKQLNLKASVILSEYTGGGTVFSPEIAGELRSLVQLKYNVILFSDSDMLAADNLKNFLTVYKEFPNRIFVIFDSRDTYIAFRQKTNIATANITHF